MNDDKHMNPCVIGELGFMLGLGMENYEFCT